jgi:hypothetical protein
MTGKETGKCNRLVPGTMELFKFFFLGGGAGNVNDVTITFYTVYG